MVLRRNQIRLNKDPTSSDLNRTSIERCYSLPTAQLFLCRLMDFRPSVALKTTMTESQKMRKRYSANSASFGVVHEILNGVLIQKCVFQF